MADDEEVRTIKRRRLRELEKQAALFGGECPPHITIEIADLRRQLGISIEQSLERDHVLTVLANAALLDQLIASQYRFLRMYFLIAGTLVVFGMLITLIAFLITQALDNLWSLGGLFVSSLCVVPLREMMSRQEKIDIFATLKTRLSAIEQAQAAADLVARQRIDDLVWRVLEKTAVG